MATVPDLFKNLIVRRAPKGSISSTPTFKPQSAANILATPTYRDHLADILSNRTGLDSRAILQDLFRNDPDVSATVASYLTLADTPLSMLVIDYEGQIDPAATQELTKLVRALTRPTDYTKGFTLKPNLQMICQELRYMLLLRGALGVELVFDKNLVPSRLQQVDMATIEWFETEAGNYKPRQKVAGVNGGVMLDIPSFFVAFHRRDPTKIYATSDFVSVINTVAARQTVINDLYRIMQVTGFPRLSLKVMEEVLMKSAPASVKEDPAALAQWANSQLAGVANTFSNLRSDQAFAHFDSVEASVINEKNPGAGMDISKVIEVLNAQNQAALKTMATVIGRGTGSVQVASAEVRIAAMNADQLNIPVKQILDQSLTFLLNSYGIPGFVEVTFPPAELRPDLELEPQKVLRQSRLHTDLSLGLITDEEYHLRNYGRLPPKSAPLLSGTGFDTQAPVVNTDNVSPNANGGSLNKSLVPEGGGAKAVKSNGTKA